MKKNSKEINGKLIKESLIDYNNIAGNLKEDIADQVQSMLAEQVRETFKAILNESEDDDEDFDVEQVEDTTEEPSESEDENAADIDEPTEGENDNFEGDEDTDDAVDGMEPTEEVETTETETEVPADVEDTDAEGEDELADDFGQYKTSDGKYDLRNAQDDEIVKVYKLLKPNDGVTVVKDNDKVKIADTANDTEYIVDFGADGENESPEEDNEFEDEDMNESRIFEIALNEYDSHVGYTDNYQSKDVMTTDGMSEPSKYGRDIDKGVPTGDSKPWANPKKKSAPFDKGGAKNEGVDECGGTEGNEIPMEEQTIAHCGAKKRMKGVKSPVPNTSGQDNPYNPAEASVAGVLKTNTSGKSSKNEAINKRLNKILKENAQLKAMITKFEAVLKEAAVTNVNLGGIVKLMMENSTSKEEKKNIINRFTNEAHTVNESKNLYERISNELKQKPQNGVNINEEKQFANKSTEVINESKLYEDAEVMSSLGLMHRICK